MELWLKGLLEIVGKLKFLHNNLQKIKEERIPLLFFLTLSMIVSGIELQYFPSKTQHRCVWFHIRILQFGIQYSFKISVSRHKSVSIRFPVPGPFASLARHNRRGAWYSRRTAGESLYKSAVSESIETSRALFRVPGPRRCRLFVGWYEGRRDAGR